MAVTTRLHILVFTSVFGAMLISSSAGRADRLSDKYSKAFWEGRYENALKLAQKVVRKNPSSRYGFAY